MTEQETPHRTPIVLKRSKLRRQMLGDSVSSLFCVCVFSCAVYLQVTQSEMPPFWWMLCIMIFSVAAISFFFTLIFYWNYYGRFRFEIDSDGFYCTAPGRGKPQVPVAWTEEPEVFSVPFVPFYSVRVRCHKPDSLFPKRDLVVPPRSWIENTDEVDAVLETVAANSIAKTLLKEK